MSRALVAAILLLAVVPVRAVSGEWSLSGSVGVELRYFPDEPLFDGQLKHTQPSVFLVPEFRWRSDDRRHQVKVTPFGRVDGRDDERTHVDLREAFYRRVGSQWELLVGLNQVFWGVTESRHLVD
ncbi:MAG: hypothetical protein ACE5FJ_04770, partial [Gemmatimonadales bacterium]